MCYRIAGVYDYAGAIATLQPRKKERKKKSSYFIHFQIGLYLLLCPYKMPCHNLKCCAVSLFLKTLESDIIMFLGVIWGKRRDCQDFML